MLLDPSLWHPHRYLKADIVRCQVSECDQCGGTGQQSTPCGTCGGDGRVRKSKKINLRIPAGVDDGSRLRVRGEGNAGRRGGENGDLYVFLSVKPDKGKPNYTSVYPASAVHISPISPACILPSVSVHNSDAFALQIRVRIEHTHCRSASVLP